MKVHRGKILLEDFHFERLFTSLRLLNIKQFPEKELLTGKILELCNMNLVADLGRVRLSAYREGHEAAGYAIEALPLTYACNEWNEKGLLIDLYPNARKSTDAFSNLKTANFLPYLLAELYAREKGLDDCLVLNSFNHICDSSKANIFLISNGKVFTPALHQGCINGVMRRYILECLKGLGYSVIQGEIAESDLYGADEVFLTNAITGMRWVSAFRDKSYTAGSALAIYRQILSRMYGQK